MIEDRDGHNGSPCTGLVEMAVELDDECEHSEVETQVETRYFHWCHGTFGPRKNIYN